MRIVPPGRLSSASLFRINEFYLNFITSLWYITVVIKWQGGKKVGLAQEEFGCFSLSYKCPGGGGKLCLQVLRFHVLSLSFLSLWLRSCSRLWNWNHPVHLVHHWKAHRMQERNLFRFQEVTQEVAHFIFHTLLEKTHWPSSPRIDGLVSVTNCFCVLAIRVGRCEEEKIIDGQYVVSTEHDSSS